MKIASDKKLVNRLFWVFLLAHVIGWTLVPAFIRHNLPLDALEGTTWGRQLEWGYDKNPFLNAWLTALATYLGGERMVYFFSQLSVAACFWSVFQLGKKILSPVYAVLAVLVLEGLQYTNVHAIDFNDNVLELGLWALTVYFFYQAITTRKLVTWLLTGFFAALGVMAKYYTLALIASLAIVFLIDKDARAQLKTRTPYMGLLLFLIIITPHTIWLFFHQFVTINYVFLRTSAEPSWLNHINFPLQFTVEQFQVLIPTLILFGLLFISKKPLLSERKIIPTPIQQKIIFLAAWMPLILTLLLSLITGAKLRAGWGMPLLSFIPLYLFTHLQPRISRIKLMTFTGGILMLLALLLTLYTNSIINSTTESSANYPGKEISRAITTQWQKQFHTPLKYVAGPRRIGGNISFYSKERPAVYMEWNPLHAPWIDENDLKKQGAVFVWDINNHGSLPDDVKKRFPNLLPATVMEFSYDRNVNHLAPIKIGVAFLPPTQ